MVTAGFKCAFPPTPNEVNTPTNTAIAQAVVITIQPELLPFILPSRTLATTPSPSRIRNIVPTTSPRNICILSLLNLYIVDRCESAYFIEPGEAISLAASFLVTNRDG